jgi:transcription elongation factor Elf1
MDYVVAGRISTDTAVALVSQNAEMVSGQISQLQILVGEKLDASPLVETHRTVVGLATKLASLAKEDSPVTKTVLNEISAELTGVSERLQARTATPVAQKKARDWIPTQVVSVECPECSASNSYPLSTAPGATAFVNCVACRAGFNIHRRLGGEVIVRMLGGGLTTAYAELAMEPASTGRHEIAFECLECEASLTVSVAADERVHHRTVICLACGSAYRVNLSNESVTLTGRYEREIGEIARWTGSQPWTVCPTCRRHLRCGLRNESGHFAFCKDDKKLISISVAAFDEFKSSHARG